MVETYDKIISMQNILTLKIEHEKKTLDNIKKLLYVDSDSFIPELIKLLVNKYNSEYKFYKVVDINNIVSSIIVNIESSLFINEIKNKEYINFELEELIDNRLYDNKNDIIILDYDSVDRKINLEYMCDIFKYTNLSYSSELISILEEYIEKKLNVKFNDFKSLIGK